LVPADHKARTSAGQLLEEQAPYSFHVGSRPWLVPIEPAAQQVGIPVQTQESVRLDDPNPVGVKAAPSAQNES
jgi:hypothetical protein